MASLSGTTGGSGGIGGTVGGWNVGFGGRNIGRRVGRTDSLGSKTGGGGGKSGQTAVSVDKKVAKAKSPMAAVAAPREVLGRRAAATSLASEEVETGIMGVTMTKTPGRVGGLEAMREPGVPAGFTPASPTSYQRTASLTTEAEKASTYGPVKPTTSQQVAKELGPGAWEAGQFQPERGIKGQIRDAFGYERGVSPGLAATAMQRDVLGSLTSGIRSGVVQTEDEGRRARRDPIGSMLTMADVATSFFGLPSPTQMTSPIGAAMGVAPILGTAQSLYGAFEEQQALSALSKAGVIEQAPARGARPAPITDAQYETASLASDRMLGGRTYSRPQTQTSKVKPYNEEAVRRARLKGFGSTIRTGAYGITGPLAVRV